MNIEQEALTESTRQWLEKAKTIFGRDYIMPKLDFSLTGATAGRAFFERWTISYNVPLYNRQPSIFLSRTVPHELAHLITWNMYGTVIARHPHGYYWKGVMRKLGLEPIRCHSYDTEGIVRRHERPFKYKCPCRTFHLTRLIHRKILNGQRRFCGTCKTTIQFVGTT